MSKKKNKTDYRFSRVRLSDRPYQTAKPSKDGIGVISVTPPSPDYQSPAEGESPSWITFIGLAELSRVPSHAAIIAIEGNSNTYNVDWYQRFADVLFIKINSRDDWRNPDITEELYYTLAEFHEKHKATPIYVQCSAGEQRSAAIASGIADEFDRYLDLSAPGCIGTTGLMDKGVYRAFHKIAQTRSNVIG